jgi:coenzyme F420-reducing hydrogenase gamma subunit
MVVRRKPRPTVALWKLTSCDGCQRAIAGCDASIRALAGRLRVIDCGAKAGAFPGGRYDLSLVEGPITTPEDADRVRAIRQSSKRLVVIGACGTADGLHALRNFAGSNDYVACVYASPQYVATLGGSTAISDHVPVDFELRGCPVERGPLLEVISAFTTGRTPNVPTYSVCIECKRKGIVCGLVAFGPPCMGPVTQAGCNALCPEHHLGCFGCHGPKESANPTSLRARWLEQGVSRDSLLRLYHDRKATAGPFRPESE